MNTLKAIQTSGTPSKHAFLHRERLTTRRNIMFPLCKSNNAGDEPSPPEGDSKKQELLVRIAMLQTQKVRVSNYLDERSAYLTQFAEEATTEFDEIAENARKGLDEAGDRIMEKLDSRMQEFEESAESNRLEIEMNEKKVAEFESQLQKDRNEGLFFKNLGTQPPADKTQAKEEGKKLKELTWKSAGSNTRKNIYLAFIGLLTIGIADALITNSSDWTKVATLGVIIIGLLSQLVYEQSISSKAEKADKEDEQR